MGDELEPSKEVLGCRLENSLGEGPRFQVCWGWGFRMFWGVARVKGLGLAARCVEGTGKRSKKTAFHRAEPHKLCTRKSWGSDDSWQRCHA